MIYVVQKHIKSCLSDGIVCVGIWEKYYDETDCIVFVVDSSDVGRLMEAKLAFGENNMTLKIFLMSNLIYTMIYPLFAATTCDNESVKQVPIIVWATKQDLPVSIDLNVQ